MALDMSTFVTPTMLKSLAWLGKNKWISLEKVNDEWLINTDKALFDSIHPQDKKNHNEDHWKRVYGLLNASYFSAKEQLLTYALSRSIAFGPKMFRPEAIQCRAFENTNVDIPFEQYAQPYESLLIEFPHEYIQSKLKEGLKRCPKYVISWYDRELSLIVVACQFSSSQDRIVGILSLKPEHNTIEALLSSPVYYEADGSSAEDIADFKVAQTFERIAINLNLLMMYGQRKHTLTPVNKDFWKKYHDLKKKKKHNPELEALKSGQIQEIEFAKSLDQYIGFKVEVSERTPVPRGGTHASPRPHWRKGCFAMQKFGPGSAMRKVILRPPVFVVGKDYKGMEIDLENTNVVYQQEGDPWVG